LIKLPKILNFWKRAIVETKSPIKMLKSQIFCQSDFLRIKKIKIEKIIIRPRFRKPSPLRGEPQKLKRGSKEKIVAKRKTKKRAIKSQKD